MTDDWRGFFSGKRATQLGLGLLGRGVKDADFLASHCAELVVTDKKEADRLAVSVDRLKTHDNIRFVLGEHRLKDFEDRDFILKGAGVPLESAEIAHAREQGIPVYMDEALFAKLAPECVVVGVTGTRGKTTTTMLLHHIVAHAQATLGVTAHLAGNIKEVATLPMLEIAKTGDIVVTELSSWQLQGFGDAVISPRVAVFTNFLPDHLNYYHDDMAAYFLDKSFIFSNQTEGGTLVCTEQAREQIDRNYPGGIAAIKSRIVIADDKALPDFVAESPLIGEHNARNVACAVEAARALGVSDALIMEAVATFMGAPGRLEKIMEIEGVSVYDDTTSTTPEALVAAVTAVGEDLAGAEGPDSALRRMILIMGGADKGLDFSVAFAPIARYAKCVLMTPGNGTTRIVDDVQAACAPLGVQVTVAASTADAVAIAREQAEPGDTILFSPGFASFAEFKNEYDRGERFREFVAAEFGRLR